MHTPKPKMHSLSDYGKTTNEGCDLPHFAKSVVQQGDKTKNISSQNVPKHGVFGRFEKGIYYD